MEDSSNAIVKNKNVSKSILEMNILKGTNISKKQNDARSGNSFVKLFICGASETPKNTRRSFRSNVIKKSLNPLWNLETTSEVDPEEDLIIIQVYIKNKLLPDDCLGSIHFYLSQLKFKNVLGSSGNYLIFNLLSSGSTRNTVPSTIHVCLSYSCQPTFPFINHINHDVSVIVQKVEEGTEAPVFQYKLLEPKNGYESLPPGWVMSTTPGGRIFYLNHDLKLTTWRDPRIRIEENLLGPLPENWEEMVNEDGSLFYIDHLNKITQWEDPRLNKFDGPEIVYSFEFKEKQESFLKSLGIVLGTLQLKVRRENIFRDSYKRIAAKDGIDLKQKLNVKFVTEYGLDGGGMAREWFCLLSRQMFSPQYGLFEYSASYSLQISPLSSLATASHLSLFQFAGKICAMAIYHRKLIEVTFTRSFYKMMLEEEIDLEDIKSDDEEYYNSLRWIYDNNPEILDLTFSVTEDSMGQKSENFLRPGGDKIKLANENKNEYVKLMLKWKFVDRIKEQMDSFLKGFSEIIPPNMLKIFSPDELKLLLTGLPYISVADWKENTKYKGIYFPNHPVVLRFWKAVYLLSQDQRSSLLRFVTGTPRAPMNGFAELCNGEGGHPFTIEDWGECSQLPLARTCFNRLYLPPYATYKEMEDKICRAIENSDCFDGVD